MTPLRALVLLAALYLAQGLPYGFFTQALPVLMRDAGYSLTAISAPSLLFVPWALKFLWAPWVDRWGSGKPNHRKRWILVCVFAVMVVLAITALFPREWLFGPGFVLLVALLCDGHLLVEGAPGLAKTRAIKVLSHSVEGDFQRLQFTLCLRPSPGYQIDEEAFDLSY